MILILSHSEDPHARAVMEKLADTDADVYWFDPGDFPSKASISLQYEPGNVQSMLRTQD